MASISTHTPKGSESTPIALRAAMPDSGPKISANNSLQPLITAGCWVNSGSAVDRAENLHHATNAVETAELFSERGENAQPGKSGGGITGGNIQSAPTRPVTSFPSGFDRQMSGGVDQIVQTIDQRFINAFRLRGWRHFQF